MRRRSALLPVCLVGTLLLASACSEGEDTPGGSEDPTSTVEPDATPTTAPVDDATTEPADDVTTTEPPADGGATTTPPADAATTTAPPSDDAGQTAAPEGSGGHSTGEEAAAFPLEEVQPRVDRLLRTAADARGASGSEARGLRDAAFTRVMRFVTLGEEQLREADASGPSYDPFVNRLQGNVLAISRDDGELPWFALVQTVQGGGNPQLSLVRGTDAGDVEESGISWSAEMLPGTEVGGFAPRGQGSPVARPDSADAERSDEVLDDLAGYLDYPRDTPAEIETNGYAPQVRLNAEDQAQALAGQASLAVTNEVDEDSITTLELADGSSMTFAAIERSVELSVTPGSVLTPPDTVNAFIPATELTEYATVDSLVLVAVQVPADGEGRPALIAVAEQVIDAEGE